jgi:signal transduction histidine kinase
MDACRIWLIGNDRDLLSGLSANLGRDGFAIEHFPDSAGAFKQLPGSQPDILFVDGDISEAVELLGSATMRAALASRDMVTVFIARDRSHLDAAEAIRAGYDIYWDADNAEYAMLKDVLAREMAKKTNSSDSDKGIRVGIPIGGSAFNETVVALAEGAVELLKLKEDLEMQNAELRLIRDELEQFVHSVSHDLKEPLMGLRTFTRVLGDELGGVKGRASDQLRLIRGSVDLMARQIDSLLAFSRAGRVKPNAVVDDVVGLIGQVISARGYDHRDGISVKVASTLPAIKGAPEQVKQIFGNLISNGIKYNRGDRKMVEIGVAASMPRGMELGYADGEVPGGYTLFYVSDNGIGMPCDDREAPFELFRRLAGTEEIEGDGAGLAIVKRAVTSLGGSIDYIAEEGKGTTMFFTLPTAGRTAKAAPSKSKEEKRSVAQLKAALLE